MIKQINILFLNLSLDKKELTPHCIEYIYLFYLLLYLVKLKLK